MTTLEEDKAFWEGVRVFEPREKRVIGDDKREMPEKKRGRVLLKAVEIINGERQDSYGNPEDTFGEIAEVWNWWLGDSNAPISRSDVAMMMCLMKIAREKNGAEKIDNIVDACGYLGLYEDMKEIAE